MIPAKQVKENHVPPYLPTEKAVELPLAPSAERYQNWKNAILQKLQANAAATTAGN